MSKEYNVLTSGVCETTCKHFNHNIQSFIKSFEIASDVVKAELGWMNVCIECVRMRTVSLVVKWKQHFLKKSEQFRFSFR